MARVLVLIAACLLPMLIATGCGGDDETGAASNAQTTATSVSISKADYIARSDALCAQANQFIRGLNLNVASALQQGDYRRAADAVEAELARIKPQYEELVNLPKPPGDEKRLNELNDLRSQVLARIERLAEAFRTEDDARIRRASQELAEAGQLSREVSSGYGFTACGQG